MTHSSEEPTKVKPIEVEDPNLAYDDDFDDLLDDALGDFNKPKPVPTEGNDTEDPSFDEDFMKQLTQGMEALLGQGEAEVKGKLDNLLNPSNSTPKEASGSFQSTIDQTLNKLKDSSDKAKTEVKGDGMDAMMEELMKQMEGLTDSGDFESAIEGMMGQIMGKDLLYEPMKDLVDKYPEWLENNNDKLNEEERTRYQSQYEIVKKVLEEFDGQVLDDKGEVVKNEANETSQKKVMDLMKKMQELGQPPADLLKMISPDLEVGEDGVPKMPKELDECSIM